MMLLGFSLRVSYSVYSSSYREIYSFLCLNTCLSLKYSCPTLRIPVVSRVAARSLLAPAVVTGHTQSHYCSSRLREAFRWGTKEKKQEHNVFFRAQLLCTLHLIRLEIYAKLFGVETHFHVTSACVHKCACTFALPIMSPSPGRGGIPQPRATGRWTASKLWEQACAQGHP